MTPQDLMGKYEKALESQKWHNIEPLMHNDICVTFSTGTFKGKLEVKQVFEKNFSLIKEERYSISNLHWVFIGKESATCIYHFHWEGIINGQKSSGGGRGTSVLVHISNQWQIVTEHLGPHSS